MRSTRERLGFYLSFVSSMALVLTLTTPAAGVEPAGKPIRSDAIGLDLAGLRNNVGNRSSYVFFEDTETGVYRVFTNAPVEVFDRVASKYPDRIVVVAAEIGLTRSRLNDSPSPFRAGAAVNDGISLCTTGYVVKKRGTSTRYLATAGHCFPQGATTYANRYAYSGSVSGTVTHRDYPAYETELIGGKSYTPYMYFGGPDATQMIPIFGRLIDTAGTGGLCRSGQTTGTKCNWTLTNTNATFCHEGNCTSYVNAYDAGGNGTQGGDSGGPVYQPYNNGTTNGALLSGEVFGYSCFFGCTYYGEKIGTVLGRWDMDLVCIGTCTFR